MGADIGQAVLMGALQGTTLEVKTELAPPITIDLSGLADGGPPSSFARLARPTYTLRKQGAVLLQISPAGPTDEDAWKVTLLVSVLASLALIALAGALMRK